MSKDISKLKFLFIFLSLGLAFQALAQRTYRIGDQGKKFVTKAWLNSVGKNEYNGALSSAEIIFQDQHGFGSGTGFYIGKIQGKNILVTNHHVVPNQQTCNNVKAILFPFSKRPVKCVKVIKTFPEIDTTLLEVKMSKGFEKFLKNKKLIFDFETPLVKGTPLMSFGYGFYKNKNRFQRASTGWRGEAKKIMGTRDQDCKIFSPDEEVRVLNGVHLVSTGCDGSPGDSGSAVLSKESGMVLGIASKAVSSGAPWRANSAKLNEVFNGAGPVDLVWAPMWTYMVPASKIYEFFEAASKSSGEEASVIREILKASLES